MKLSYCDNYERTQKYAEAMWNHEMLDRPFACVTGVKRGMALPKEGVFECPRNGFLAMTMGDYAPIFNTFEEIASATFYGGEALPWFNINPGPDIFAGYLGGKLRCVPYSDTTWAEKTVEDWEDYPIRLDRSPEGYFEKTRAYIEYAAGRSEGKYLTGMMDLHGNMDAMSALRGPEDLCCDLIDCPDTVFRKLQEINDLYPEVYNMIYEAGRISERGTLGWIPTYCKGKFAVLQCDFIALISPEMCRKYVMPAIERESEFLDHCIYHLDGPDALRHLDDVLALPRLDMIQWVPGDGQPRTVEWMDVLKKCQAAGKSVLIYDWTEEELRTKLKELDPALVAITYNAGTQDKAEAFLDWLEKEY